MSRATKRPPPLSGLVHAIEFLTVLPVRRPRANQAARTDESPDMAWALPWFPLVGAMLGLAFVVLDWGLSFAFPLGIRAVALLAFDAMITGMLHLDGFVDCCDALPGARTVGRRLDILRDSRIGAYGALSGALVMIARFSALSALVGPPRVLALLIAPVIGRWGMVYAVTRYRYARSEGVGTPFRGSGMSQLILATMSLLLLLASNALAAGSQNLTVVMMFALAGMLLLAALITLFAWLRWASRRLGGGLTGDTYGAACVLVELAVLVLAPPLASLTSHLLGQ